MVVVSVIGCLDAFRSIYRIRAGWKVERGLYSPADARASRRRGLADPLRFIVWSDYLCPWCFNASVRLRGIEAEYGGRVEFEWRSFLLRPNPRPGRSLEKFVRYTQSWMRPAAEDDAGTFRVWATRHGPPSHSIPPQLLVKAARRCAGDETARELGDRLFAAYFAENLDITDADTLRRLWSQCGLAEADFAHSEDADLLQQVLEDHRSALEHGVTGVPAIMLVGNDVAITGAHPRALYRRWIERTLSEREAARV